MKKSYLKIVLKNVIISSMLFMSYESAQAMEDPLGNKDSARTQQSRLTATRFGLKDTSTVKTDPNLHPIDTSVTGERPNSPSDTFWKPYPDFEAYFNAVVNPDGTPKKVTNEKSSGNALTETPTATTVTQKTGGIPVGTFN